MSYDIIIARFAVIIIFLHSQSPKNATLYSTFIQQFEI